MKYKLSLALILPVCLFLYAFRTSKPSILIIGDSISIGYTPFVKKYFADKVNITHNPGNAQHTGTGLEKIDAWLGDGKWDIIQFNWGLWDLCYRHPDSKVQGNRDKVNGKITYTVDEYAANLDSLVSALQRKTDAKLVFVTTTYVPEHEAGRFTDDAVKYNDAAKAVMKKHAVLVNDLYEPSISIHKKFGKGPDDVHYTTEGYEKLSNLVADFLKTEIRTLQNR
jgi:lysophospholipase L1-like esterase